jgi:2'-5' RNA ligase
VRVFTGLPLPEAALGRLAAVVAELKRRYPGLKVVGPEGLHITLIFFGELSEAQVAALDALLDGEGLKVPAIRAVLGGAGQFPPRGMPRVIFCPVLEGAAPVKKLHGALCELVREGGSLPLEETRELTPHVTVARNRGLPVNMAEVRALFGFEEEVLLDRLVLFQSILKPRGAEYRHLKTVLFR